MIFYLYLFVPSGSFHCPLVFVTVEDVVHLCLHIPINVISFCLYILLFVFLLVHKNTVEKKG